LGVVEAGDGSFEELWKKAQGLDVCGANPRHAACGTAKFADGKTKIF
jgi:hypothetical protein